MNLSYGVLIRGNRSFRYLLFGQYISELGSWFNFIATLGLIRVLSDASPIAAAIFIVCRTMPLALLMPVAGAFVDRFSRRRTMIISDLARVFIALIFLAAFYSESVLIVYIASALLAVFEAFFEAGKNATSPNVVKREGLLSGTALLFSSRFLLMAIGAALGGWVASGFGYQAAFIVNSISFLASAICIWQIPEAETKGQINVVGETVPLSLTFAQEIKEGISYVFSKPLVLTLMMLNVMWAVGGGAISIIYDQLGGVIFAQEKNWNPDTAVALMWMAAGFGLFGGLMLAHKIGGIVERKKIISPFMGWSIILHGVLFALAGLTMNFWLILFLIFISRALIGAEYAVQETLFQKTLPDKIRGRISTIDRGAEILVFSLSSYLSGISLSVITPQTLLIISGLFSGSAGIVWFIRNFQFKFANLENADELMPDFK